MSFKKIEISEITFFDADGNELIGAGAHGISGARTVGVTKGVTFRTGTGFGARWKTEKRAALIVTAMATITRLKPRVGAIFSH